jgi:hypothetical protein
MKHYFIQFNRSQRPLLLHPIENVPFESKEAAESHVKQIQQDPQNQFAIFEYKIFEVDSQSIVADP